MGVLNNGSEKRERVIDNRKKRCLEKRIENKIIDNR
jgi:hypothetical protein